MLCPSCLGRRRPCRYCRGQRITTGPCATAGEQARQDGALRLLARLPALERLAAEQRASRRPPARPACTCGAGAYWPTDAHAVGCPHRLVDRGRDLGPVYRGDRVDR